MSTFAQDLDGLRARMHYEVPVFIVARIRQVINQHRLDVTCPLCEAPPGVMCRTLGPITQDRSIVHTERRYAERDAA